MSERSRVSRLRLSLLLVSCACGPLVWAAEAPAPLPRAQDLTLNLIRRLVQRGVLPQADADDLIRLAEQDTAAAKAEAAAGPAARTTVAVTPAPAAPDTVRVTYVPEFVKKQLREEVKQEVLAQAREERWAAPRSVPEWVSRYTLFGDFRLRYEGIHYPSGNDNTALFPISTRSTRARRSTSRAPCFRRRPMSTASATDCEFAPGSAPRSIWVKDSPRVPGSPPEKILRR